METFELYAEKREDVGKGASRRLRRLGKLPCIVYGAGKKPEMIVLEHNKVMHNLENEAFYSHILVLKIGKTKEKVVLKDLQRHPYKHILLHMDLLRIKENEKINMRVPLHFLNEDKCHGVKTDGSVISHFISELEIVCFPKDLPEYIEIDMLELKTGEAVRLTDISTPEGVQIQSLVQGIDESSLDENKIVASVHQPKTLSSKEDEVVETEDDSNTISEETKEEDKDK